MDLQVALSPIARRRVEEHTDGERWLAELPGAVAALARHWSLTVEKPLSGGNSGLVASVLTAAGTQAVLKLALPGTGYPHALRTLTAAGGRGYARLLDADPAREALLLEALGPAVSDLDHTPTDALRILAGTLVEAWTVPPPDATPRPDKAGELAALVTDLWERLARPCPAPVVAEALACACRRAADTRAPQVLVHGDPHPANALRVRAPRPGAPTGHVFVDPESIHADAAYDLGVVLRDRFTAPSTMDGYLRLLATETGVDEDAVRDWSYLERVSSGLYLISLGEPVEGRSFLDSAARLL